MSSTEPVKADMNSCQIISKPIDVKQIMYLTRKNWFCILTMEAPSQVTQALQTHKDHKGYSEIFVG